MANPSIPSDLLEELLAAMGKPLPEEVKGRMAYWKQLRQDHPALASQLLSYIRPSKTALVSAVEQERQKVSRKEHWHSLLLGILYQENLASEDVPNRKRWVLLAAGAFVAMVGASVVLYSTKPKTDVKLGSPVAAAASAVLPKEEALPAQNQVAVGSNQVQTQATGPTTQATSESTAALPESLIPKASATSGTVTGRLAASQPSVGPAPLVEWGPPPPTTPRASYPQAYPSRTSSHGPYVNTPPVQPIRPLPSAVNPPSAWNAGTRASSPNPTPGPLSTPSNTQSLVTPPRIQGSGVMQGPELGEGQLQEQNSLDPQGKTRSEGEPLVMTREIAPPRAPIAMADQRSSPANPSPPVTSTPQVSTVAQKSEEGFLEQQTEVVSDTRLAEPLVAQEAQDTAAFQTPQGQSSPRVAAPAQSSSQTTAPPRSSSPALTQDAANEEPVHLSTQPTADPKPIQRPAQVDTVTASLPKQEITSAAKSIRQVDSAPLVAQRTVPGQPGAIPGYGDEPDEVWVASRQPLAREGGVASKKLWETPLAQTAEVSSVEPFTAQRTPIEKVKPGPSANPSTKPIQPPQAAATSPLGASLNPTPLPGNNVQQAPPDGTLLEGTLLTGIVTAEGASVPVIAQTAEGNWIGSASLNPLGRVSIRFHQLVGGGASIKIMASAFDAEGVPGVAATLEDHSPSLAADLLRAGVSGVSAFAQSFLQAGSTSVSGGVVIKEQKVPPLEVVLGGEIAKLFQLPTSHQSVVRVARVPKGSPILIAVGVSAEGLEGR